MQLYTRTMVRRFIGEENNIIVISANKVVNDDCEI